MYPTKSFTATEAKSIAAMLRRDGWQNVAERDVEIVWECGTHDNEALASAILQELARREIIG